MREKHLLHFQSVHPVSTIPIHPEIEAPVATQNALARGRMYQFLSAVYLRPPDPELLERLSEPECLEELASVFSEAAVQPLRRAVADAPEVLACIRQDYMDLFSVPTSRYVTPLEDVYRGSSAGSEEPSGPLLGAHAIAIKRMFREAGAKLEEGCTELPTHVGVELAFMSFLCEGEASRIESRSGSGTHCSESADTTEAPDYRDLQHRFLERHLVRWVPQLARRIQSNAQFDFYKGIAQLTVEFLEQETAELQIND